MRALVLVIASLTLAGCQSAAEKAEVDYEFLKKSQASDAELCRAAAKVRNAWADQGDADEYKLWQSKTYNACQDNGSRY